MIATKAMDWNNPRTNSQDIRYSRYIASWRNIVVGYDDSEEFKEWLATQNLSDDEIIDIIEMYTCGKFELERDIKRYLESKEEPA